jgi:hypothetical protein
MLEAEHRAEPDRARQSLDADLFPAQIFRRFDARRRDDIVAELIGQRRDDFQIGAARDCGQYRRAARVGHLDVARRERGHQYGRLANKNRIGSDAVLDKKTMIFGDPQRRNPGIHRGMADDGFPRRRGSLRFNTVRKS